VAVKRGNIILNIKEGLFTATQEKTPNRMSQKKRGNIILNRKEGLFTATQEKTPLFFWAPVQKKLYLLYLII
jgi:hypothetical protein